MLDDTFKKPCNKDSLFSGIMQIKVPSWNPVPILKRRCGQKRAPHSSPYSHPTYYFVHYLPTPVSTLPLLSVLASLLLAFHFLYRIMRYLLPSSLTKDSKIIWFLELDRTFSRKCYSGPCCLPGSGSRGSMLAVILNAYKPCGNADSEILEFLSISLFYNWKYAIVEPTLLHRRDSLFQVFGCNWKSLWSSRLCHVFFL